MEKYPHIFHNSLRLRIYGPPAARIEFPNRESLEGELLEFPICRSPRGEIFGGREQLLQTIQIGLFLL